MKSTLIHLGLLSANLRALLNLRLRNRLALITSEDVLDV
jgi:hypothetical protein